MAATSSGGHISPAPTAAAHRQLMAYKLQGGGGGVGTAAPAGVGLVGGANALNHGILGMGMHGGNMHNSNNNNGHGNVNGGGVGGGVGNMGSVSGLLGGGIVSGDYIDLNELLNMDANCNGGGVGGCHDDESSSLVA